jgi:hypothetical protein
LLLVLVLVSVRVPFRGPLIRARARQPGGERVNGKTRT